MPKGSPELVKSRKEEIVSVCEKLYENVGFCNITIKEIAEHISFSRASIYNYFQTKEEIFLEILKREMNLWTADLEAISRQEGLSKDDFAIEITESLCKREVMLKLFSTNLYDIEENSRMRNLVGFKQGVAGSMKAFEVCLKKFFKMDDVEVQDFIYNFYPLLNGLYAYAYRSERQHEAMVLANMKIVTSTLPEMIYTGLKKLL